MKIVVIGGTGLINRESKQAQNLATGPNRTMT